jgi:hypothetical protein
MAMTILSQSAQAWSCWSGGMQLRSGILRRGFDKRFDDGTQITEFCEGHGRQPCGYFQVCCVCFFLGAHVCDFWLRIFSLKCCNVINLDRVNLLQEQVAETILNMYIYVYIYINIEIFTLLL